MRVRVSVSVRMMMLVMTLCLALTASSCLYREVEGDPIEPVVCEPGEGVKVMILPRMELLAGVLSHTTWIEQRGPEGEGSEYYQALHEFLEPHSDHRAVQLAQRLTDRGFTYDAPPHLMFRVGPLPQLSQKHDYGSYLLSRAGSTRFDARLNLDQFIYALGELALESNFAEFFDEWRPQYEHWVAEVCTDMQPDMIIDWLVDFFGWSGNKYYTAMAPAMFPGGGYGANITTEDGELIVAQTLRAGAGDGREPAFPGGDSLQRLTIHEWGHSYVNPTIEEFSQGVDGLQLLYEPVRDQMQAQAYSSLATYLNEQVLRAVESLAVRDLFGDEAYHQHVTRNEMSGFHFTGYLAEYVQENYVPNRGTYPTFREFAPGLLEEMARLNPDDFPRLPAAPEEIRYHVTVSEVLTDPSDSTITVRLCPGDRYLAMPTTQNTQIRVLDIHEGEFTWTFTGDSLTNLGCPSWFPDGESILFRGADPEGITSLYEVTIGDEHSLVQLTDPETSDSNGDVSPCGSLAAFVSRHTGAAEVHLLDMVTREITQVTDSNSDLMWPTWSPDGRTIAFVDTERHQLGVADLEDGHIQWWELAPHTTVAWSRPQWLTDDEVIIPLSFEDRGYSVPTSVCTATGRIDLWGGGPDMLAVYDAVPIAGENIMIMTIRTFDGTRGTYYRAVVITSFERTSPRD